MDTRLEFRNCGIHGQRTDEIMARLDECAVGADMLVVQGGINDIAQGRSVAAAAENLRAMVRRGKELGLRVLLVDLLPWNNGWPDAEPKIRNLNELIAEIAAEDVTVLSFHDTLEDPDRPGRMRRGWTSTATTRRSRAIAGSASSPSGCPARACRRRRRQRARSPREAAALTVGG